MKITIERWSTLVFALVLVCATFVHAQVQVAIAPDVFPIYFGGNGPNAGLPLAGGFLYTYQAGTTTLLNTYVDSTGNAQNPDPIPLDAAGAPSNGSVETGIWLPNQAFKFCAYTAALVQQWCRDNITGSLGLLNLANTWTFQQTFSLPIFDTATDNQMVFGATGNQTTLDFPPPTGNVTLHGPPVTSSDTLVAANATQGLQNKNLGSGTEINGVPVIGGPATYIQATSTGTGTAVDYLTIFTGVGVQYVASGSTGGVIGVCVSSCGTSGSATIQQSGQTYCNFDGATTAWDYVQISSTNNGKCTDAGASYPTSGQVVGRVLTTQGSAVPVVIDLFGPEIQAGGGSICSDGTSTSLNANTTIPQIVKTCQIPGSQLNVIGKSFSISVAMSASPAGSYVNTYYFGFGTSSALGTFVQLAQATTSGITALIFTFNCTTVTTGTSGTIQCAGSSVTNLGSSAAIPFVPGPYTVNLTTPLFFGGAVAFGTASASSTAFGSQIVVQHLN